MTQCNDIYDAITIDFKRAVSVEQEWVKYVPA